MYCIKCGKKNIEAANFCLYCGTELSEALEEKANDTATKEQHSQEKDRLTENSNRKKIIPVVGAGAVALVVIVIFVNGIIGSGQSVTGSGDKEVDNGHAPDAADIPYDDTIQNEPDVTIDVSDPIWEELYAPILQEYRRAIETGFTGYAMGDESYYLVDDEKDIVSFGFRNTFERSAGSYYCFRDIDGNGIPELLISHTYISWDSEDNNIHDIWTIYEGEPVRIIQTKLSTIDLGSENVFTHCGYSGGEFITYLKIADDGKTAVVFGARVAYIMSDDSIYFIRFKEPLLSLKEWVYDNSAIEAELTPENRISSEEDDRLRNDFGFPIDYHDFNGAYVGDWQPLLIDGSPFLAMTLGKANTPGSVLNIRAAPSVDSEIVGTLHDGYDVSIIGEENGWYSIKHKGKIRYVSTDYVTV